MSTTYVQYRSVTIDYKYEVTTTVSAAGDLPQTHIFVMTIVNIADPLQDTFDRIAGVSDLLNVTIGRDPAIIAGESEYFSNSFTLYYTSLNTADAAAKAIRDSIDELIENWVLYDNSFETAPAGQTYNAPLDEPAYWEDLVEEYTTTKAEYDTAVEELAAYRQDKIDTTTDLTAVGIEITTIQSIRDQFVILYSSPAGGYIYDLWFTANALRVASGGANPVQEAALLVQLNYWTVNPITAGHTVQQLCIDILGSLNAQLAAKQTEYTTLQATYSTLERQILDKQQEVLSARQTKEQALDAIRSVKPDWTE
jgi:hypothetical protein